MLSLPEACDFVVHKARAFTPLATNSLIPKHPILILVVISHPSSSISTAAGPTSPARCRPAPSPSSRAWKMCPFPLFAATWLPHLQQQFLSLFIVLHVAICTRPQTKRAPRFLGAPFVFNVARVFRPEAFSTSRPNRAVWASRIILRGRRRA